VRGIVSPLHGFDVNPPFVTLLPACDTIEQEAMFETLRQLVERGCVEFCCAGSAAETFHDAIDSFLERHALVDIVTSWDTDAAGACEYFIHAAGGKPPVMLALVGAYDGLVDLLLTEARSV